MKKTLISGILLAALPLTAAAAVDFGLEVIVRINGSDTNLSFQIGTTSPTPPRSVTWQDVTNTCQRLANMGARRVLLLKSPAIREQMANIAAERIKSVGINEVRLLELCREQRDSNETLYREVGRPVTNTLSGLLEIWMNEAAAERNGKR